MKKLAIFSIITCCLISFVFSLYYGVLIYRNSMVDGGDLYLHAEQKRRIFVITQGLESPFTKTLQAGLYPYAYENRMDVTVVGTYRANLIELLKYMDMAIAAKADGIIVQAMDDSEFVDKVQKATGRGIPVITIGGDAPSSLRKTYVGADYHLEGELIGKRVAQKMEGHGNVCLLTAGKMTSTEQLRLQGIQNELSQYPDIHVIVEESEASRHELGQPKKMANHILNQYPDMMFFIGLNAEAGIGIAQALDDRARGEKEIVYTFDDTPELRGLIASGRITAALVNDSTEIGERCLTLIQQWLNNENLPLPSKVYTKVTFLEGRDDL